MYTSPIQLRMHLKVPQHLIIEIYISLNRKMLCCCCTRCGKEDEEEVEDDDSDEAERKSNRFGVKKTYSVTDSDKFEYGKNLRYTPYNKVFSFLGLFSIVLISNLFFYFFPYFSVLDIISTTRRCTYSSHLLRSHGTPQPSLFFSSSLFISFSQRISLPIFSIFNPVL